MTHLRPSSSRTLLSAAFLALTVFATQSKVRAAEGDTYILYRNSLIDASMRIHLASFDTTEGAAYNQENCRLAALLFRSQPGVTVSYWCEPGPYRR